MTKNNKILPFLILFLFAFTLPLNPPPSGWYQQFMPNLGGRTISDIFFLDSLTGWAVTPFVTQNDTTYVLKTTNGGDNWFIQFTGTGQFVGRNRIYFINSNTGFTCGNDHFNGSTKITKTTNGGYNWFSLNDPTTAVYNDMSVLNEDMIWLVSNSSFSTGGVFFTSNGGQSWNQQFSGGNQNPNKIYMYNARIGFICNYNAASPNIYWTTNGGLNWSILSIGEKFTDMFFIDSLTGWKCSGSTDADSSMRKTTNGGLNWVKQILPPETPPFLTSAISKFSCVNGDTLWGVGGIYRWGLGQYRGIIYKTTNGGTNWGYQLIDSAINIYVYYLIKFVDEKKGWAYAVNKGVHTVVGGDTITYFNGIIPINTKTPRQFELGQNFPNPFNPATNIRYALKTTAYVILKIYDVIGKEISLLVNQKQRAGTYQCTFDASMLSSGVYFYRIYIINEKGGELYSETKKAVLIK